ncbi:PrgI family protein [Anaerobium acetethylicum]|uniref:PrgI family protein n=1 Tax=Anaerobium acetethylicum TaxID=1619234 RepID=A0A1D3TUK3_9FIRM|nr:PrgI family protein [Anaerobium acetethylicum]SCP97758.1 PrgI family protein [Anaerobium acetethylicum]
MNIEISKDIEKYQETVAMGLTAKQLVFSAAAVLAGGTVVLCLYHHIGLTASTYIAMPAVAPIALGGFYSYNGMGFYEVMGRKMRFLTGNWTLIYVSTEGEQVIRNLQASGSKKSKR